MKKFYITIWIIVLSFVSIAQNTYRNPVITGLASDPTICRVGDDYYLATSTFEYFPGLPIYHSKDLVHWKLISYALTTPSQNPLKGCRASTGGQYAPTLRYNNGTFYIVCTTYGGEGSRGAFYVTAKDIRGPWSEPNWVGSWSCDPSLLFDGDSVYYTMPNDKSQFLQAKLSTSSGLLLKPERVIATGLGHSSPEGPHLYKIKDYYFLMSAEGGTGYDHMEVMQRSRSPWGPFEASPRNPVVSHKDYPDLPFQAIGHADIVETPDGWWLVCLGIRPVGGKYHHLGRETFLAPLTWYADGWPKVGTDGIVKEEFPTPKLPQHMWEPEPIRDDFNESKLNLNWNFIRNPYDADWSLTTRRGYLQLNGSALNFKEKDSPAFIGRRQTAFNVVASTKIQFNPRKPSEEAGLVIRGDDDNHLDLLITMDKGKRVAMFREYLKNTVISKKMIEIPDGDIILRITATELEYTFWVQQEGNAAIELGKSFTRNLATETINGFTGVFIGMYASGNGTKNTHPAYFDWFDFETNPKVPFEWAK